MPNHQKYDQNLWSGNPIIRHMRTADPSPKVWADGTLWLYCSHDQDDAQEYRTMDGYHVFSSTDLVHWTDHGEALHSRDVAWGIEEKGWMWAPDCAFKDGTYFFYFPHRDKTGEWRIGVAVGTKPQGPFQDIGHYIEGTQGIDPMCFQDDDGAAYLYFGSHQVARLKENMLELVEPARRVDYGAKNFKEGVYLHKRNGIYYYSWTDFDDQEFQGHYAMGDNPYGPFTYKGPVNRKPPGAQDHHSIVEYRGQWYYFYHVGNYPGGGWTRRNVCVDYLHYNADGTMQLVEQTSQGVRTVK
jgi:beta-xylosidase